MKLTTVTFTEAKANLSRYGRMAEKGQKTLVLKHRRSAFLIAPVAPALQARPKKPGLACGQIHLAPDFDKTPEDVVRLFESAS